MTATTIEWHAVFGLDELWEGDFLDVEVAGEPVLVVHLLGGEVKAYQGVCPHQEVMLADGDWDEESSVLWCGGHRWEFDLRTGEGVNPAGCTLYEYPVKVEDDTVYVGVPQDGQRHYNRCPGT